MKPSEVLKMLEELCPDELAELKSEILKKPELDKRPQLKALRLPCAYQMHTAVYRRLATDPEKGMIIAVAFSTGGGVIYTVAWGEGEDSRHHEIELTTVPEWGNSTETTTTI